jgi:hypothetical protein
VTRAGYDRASGKCAGRSQPGAQALMAWCLATYDNASNLGIYACRSVRGGTSKSVHADGRALDVAFPLDRGLANSSGHDLSARLTAHADVLGIQLVIYDRSVWSSKTKRWAPHTGASGPHLDHVHIEITWAAARGPEALTVEEIKRYLGPPIAPPEDDMPRYKDWPDEDKMLLAADVANAVIALLGEKEPSTLAGDRLLKAAHAASHLHSHFGLKD